MQRTHDIIEISQLIQAWGHCRDQGRWDDLAAIFTEDGTISVTWFSGPFRDFVDASRRMHQPRGPRVKHLIGQPVVQLNGTRALAETNVQILGRFDIAGTPVDYTSYARFLDRLELGAGGWQIRHREAVYEKDRLDPVVPGADFTRFMAETDFSDLPEPFRYLGYRLLSAGRALHPGILSDGAPEAEAALAGAQDWLAGSA
ncbi:nuclear transport factor 2 family protein [Oceanicola sp. S124]|uniref:nuclear transport factor 2 family protein n=1 Tax=Oceanicola sp. S124 TaxID=1042378 RepID=UPI000255902B|nr:nuclear transport factor 2 family protein [Oceanicola sp. S124]